MKKMLFFDSMLTPKIVTAIFWLLLLAALGSGLGVIVKEGVTATSFVLGIFTIGAGAIGARVWCEIMIVIFKIHENLKKLAEVATATAPGPQV